MNSHTASNCSLEAEFYRITRKRSQPHQSVLKSWAQVLIDFLTGAQPLSIRRQTQKNGTFQWIVYDAASDTRCVFDTEQAVRVWLETRHQRATIKKPLMSKTTYEQSHS